MAKDEAGSYIPSWLSQAAEHSASKDYSNASCWPARFDRLLTARLRSQLQAEQFCTLSDVAGLLPCEVQELDDSLPLQAATAVIEVASRLARNDNCEALEQSGSGPSFSLLSTRVQVCKLQPIQVQRSSFVLTATEQKALPIQGKDRRQYFLELLWFVFMVIGSAGLLWSADVASDPDAAKAGFLMKFSTMSVEQLAPPINTFKRWVEWHNFNVAGDCRFWEVRATSLHCWFASLVGRGQTVVHNILRYLTWWRTHVGLQFPIHDAILAGWHSASGPGLLQPKEVAPLQLHIFLRLVDVSSASFGAIAQFCSLALVILASCLRFKHFNISCAIHRSGDFLRGTCIRGKKRSAGRRPPFDWGCPWNIGGKEPFRCVLILQQELRQALGKDPGFLLPHFQGKTKISEHTRYEARPMSYPRFLAFFRNWLISIGVCDEEARKFVSYTLRRFLPSCADLARVPLSVRQELGNWTEVPFATKQIEAAKTSMSVHYAHGKVETAADSKAKLLAGIYEVQKHTKGDLTWDSLRCERYLWDRLLQLQTGAMGADRLARESDDDFASSTDQAGGSSSGSSSTDEESKIKNPDDVSWFRQPGSRVTHALQASTELRLVPWCRDASFRSLHVERGVGFDSDMKPCPGCLKRMPKELADVVRNSCPVAAD